MGVRSLRSPPRPTITTAVDGLAAVQARIAAIESRFAVTPGAAATNIAPGSAATFDAVLAAQLGSATTPAVQRLPGQYGPLQPPSALLAYGNGRVPAEALTPIGDGTHRLHAPAARAFEQLRAAAEADGLLRSAAGEMAPGAGGRQLAGGAGVGLRLHGQHGVAHHR